MTSVRGAAFDPDDPCAESTDRNVWTTGNSDLADSVHFALIVFPLPASECCLRITTDVLDVSGNNFDDEGIGPAQTYETWWDVL